MSATLELQNQYEFDVYPKRDVVIVRGKGATVWDENGKAYIDCVAGHGVANLGHANEAVIDAIVRQAQILITCSGTFYNDQKALLLEKLIRITPKSLTRAFLCNSGTESIEAAIKFVRFTAKKPNFICAMKSFHGRTMGALSATFNPKYRQDFEPLVPGFNFVPFNNFEKMQQAITAETAAILLEPVQGEGGVNLGEKDYFQKVRKLCDETGIILIIDEVQSGFCRTGKLFAIEHFDVEPDILCLAKSIAGGLPMGAVVCSDKIEAPVGNHGSTFGGNPLACAAASAAIDFMLEQKLAQQAEEKGKYLAERLVQYNFRSVREIRQIGLMIGIEMKEKVKPYIIQLIDEGLLTLPAGSTVLRLLPPLTISYDELDAVLEKLKRVLA
ncbi:acetylornithine/succinylornithine family transaminase [candidate division KSB1 bacterium]|nr:acetylornithine/succinylornithine family transaminase [candidate division KSB1 bacterium]